jgi:hypothetical protein
MILRRRYDRDPVCEAPLLLYCYHAIHPMQSNIPRVRSQGPVTSPADPGTCKVFITAVKTRRTEHVSSDILSNLEPLSRAYCRLLHL